MPESEHDHTPKSFFYAVLIIVTGVFLTLGLVLGNTLQHRPEQVGQQVQVYPGAPEQPGGHTMVKADRPGNGPNTWGTSYSSNWSGYAATGPVNKYSEVRATWTEPAVNCHVLGNPSWQMAATWVGLDGDGSPTVEQAGTVSECNAGVRYDYAWYEMYPDAMVALPYTVVPGNVMSSSVVRSGDSYTLTVNNLTRGWTETIRETGSYDNSSAEVIVEAPYSGGILPLADFGTDYFQGEAINNQSLPAEGAKAIDMVNSSDTYLLDNVSGLADPSKKLPATHDRWNARWDAFNGKVIWAASKR